MLTQGMTFTRPVHFRSGGRGARKVLEDGPRPAPAVLPGRVPRVARIMALALRLERLLRAGHLADRGDIADLGHVTAARVSQIMNLLNLAPDIQEAILFLPRVERGRDPLRERTIRPIASTHDWRKQRRLWDDLKSKATR